MSGFSTNPSVAAAEQAAPSAEVGWVSTFRDVMGLWDPTRRRAFANQPRGNRFETILEAVVPSRQDPTHEKVLALVNALVDNGAVRPEEAGQIYDALLQRVSRYNSTNVQMNLDRMVRDVRDAVSERTRQQAGPSLASLQALNGFLATLPASVPRGQADYAGFVSALRLLVSEVPQVDVYQAGPDFYLQTSRGGAQTVNLTRAFQTLEPLWGVHGATSGRSSAASLLTPNARLLLLLTAPFTDNVGIGRDSYIGHLLSLYRETLSQTVPDEQTFREITDVSRSGLRETDTENLRGTLNFLVSGRRQTAPQAVMLSPEQERLLRYVQQAVSLYLTQHGADPANALDQVAADIEPSVFHRHRAFLNRLFDYLRRAAALNANYFHSVILNALWHPPPGFFTGQFDIPPAEGPLDNLEWDQTFDRYRPVRPVLSETDWDFSRPPSVGSDRLDSVLDAARGSTSSLGSLMSALNRFEVSDSGKKFAVGLSDEATAATGRDQAEAEAAAESDDVFEGSGLVGGRRRLRGGAASNPFSYLAPRGGAFGR